MSAGFNRAQQSLGLVGKQLISAEKRKKLGKFHLRIGNSVTNLTILQSSGINPFIHFDQRLILSLTASYNYV